LRTSLRIAPHNGNDSGLEGIRERRPGFDHLKGFSIEFDAFSFGVMWIEEQRFVVVFLCSVGGCTPQAA